MSLTNENTGVVNGVSHLALSNEGLEATFHELVDSQTEHVIELFFGLFEETKSDHTTDKGIAYNLSL